MAADGEGEAAAAAAAAAAVAAAVVTEDAHDLVADADADADVAAVERPGDVYVITREWLRPGAQRGGGGEGEGDDVFDERGGATPAPPAAGEGP